MKGVKNIDHHSPSCHPILASLIFKKSGKDTGSSQLFKQDYVALSSFLIFFNHLAW